jgi:potassium channel subfamily K
VNELFLYDMKSPKQWVYYIGLPAPKRLEGFWRWLTHGRLRTLRIFAKYCPLIAAVFAPLSTLLDIPALTVRHPCSRF